MVTGIEITGVALGLFPLLIEGIDVYISSAEKVKEIMRHKRTLSTFKRELEMEKSVFYNTWYTLGNRAGDGVLDLEGILSCLPSYSADSFNKGYQELNTILGELVERFQKYEQDKVGTIYFS